MKLQGNSDPGDWNGKPDAVYLWYDPADPSWAERRQALHAKIHPTAPPLPRMPSQSSLDELRFSLRSFEKFGDGFGNLFLVVDHQLPSWLIASSPRLKIVQVEDLMAGDGYYPTYNSQAIESYFHQIPDLSDRFVYFNDDFFLRRSVHGGQFFSMSGMPKYRLGRGIAPVGRPAADDQGDTLAHKNSSSVLNSKYGNRRRLTVGHRPYPQHRKVWEWAESEFSAVFDATRSERFRKGGIHALHSLLLPHAGASEGHTILLPPRLREKDMYYWSNDPRRQERVATMFEKSPNEFVCIQEDRGISLNDDAAEAFQRMMTRSYPDPSSFENDSPT